MNESDILNLIKNDQWMMDVLRVARGLDLPDWMIGAGFVRNKVWDYLHSFENKEVQTSDIDLIYYDPNDLSEETEDKYQRDLSQMLDVDWSATNQARIHVFHGREEQYKNSEEALSEWIETPTCVAVRLNKDDSLSLFAPHGIDDLVNLVVRPVPIPNNRKDADVYKKRIEEKKWQEKWTKLLIFNI